MYTCPGSIDLGDRLIIWQREETAQVCSQTVEHDIDFLQRTTGRFDSIRAYIRFFATGPSLRYRIADGTSETWAVFNYPPETSLDEALSVAIAKLRLNEDTQWRD